MRNDKLSKKILQAKTNGKPRIRLLDGGVEGELRSKKETVPSKYSN